MHMHTRKNSAPPILLTQLFRMVFLIGAEQRIGVEPQYVVIYESCHLLERMDFHSSIVSGQCLSWSTFRDTPRLHAILGRGFERASTALYKAV